MTRFYLVALLALSLTACANAGTATLDPRVQAAAMNEMDKINATATAMSQGVNNAAFNQSLTQAFVPPALTATALNQHATELANASAAEHATQVAFNYSTSITLTQQAFAVIESDTQRQISENNRAIADGIRQSDFWHSVLEWGALIIIFAVSIVATWGVIQFGILFHTFRHEWEKEIKKQIEWRVYRKTKDEAGSDFLLTSAGPMVRTHAAVTLAEKHVATYDRASKWRGMLKAYTARCIELGREGVKHPFSRPTCAEYALLTRPDRAEWWQLGHKRAIGMLFDMGILTNDTGQGGEVVLAIDSGSVARVIDTTPLPELPPDPIPVAKITLATSQV